MPGNRNEQAVRIARIDGDLRDLLTVAQAEMCPGASGVCRFVDTVSDGKIRTLQSFAAADINDVRI